MRIIGRCIAIVLLCGCSASENRSTSRANSSGSYANPAPPSFDDNLRLDEDPPECSDPCDKVAMVCGAEGGSAVVDLLTSFGPKVFTIKQCALELGLNLPPNALNLIGLNNAAFWELVTSASMEAACDVIKCFPPTGPALPYIGACTVGNCLKGGLNCWTAMKECHHHKLSVKPIKGDAGVCSASSILAPCINTQQGSRPATDQEITTLCSNLAHSYGYHGSSEHATCVKNCVDLTKQNFTPQTCQETTYTKSCGSTSRLELVFDPEADSIRNYCLDHGIEPGSIVSTIPDARREDAVNIDVLLATCPCE